MADTKISDATPTTPQATDVIPIARPGSTDPLSVTVAGLFNSSTLTGVATLNGELVSPTTLPAIDYPTINLTSTVTDTGANMSLHGAGFINLTPTLESIGGTNSSDYYGIRSRLNIGAGNTSNWTNPFGSGAAYLAASTLTGATGTVNTFFGVKVSCSSGAPGLTITNAYGVWQAAQSFAGTCTNSVGGLFSAGGGVNNCDLLLGEPTSYPVPPTGNWTLYSRNLSPSLLSGALVWADALAQDTSRSLFDLSPLIGPTFANTGYTFAVVRPTLANTTADVTASSLRAFSAAFTIDATNTKNFNILTNINCNSSVLSGAVGNVAAWTALAAGVNNSSAMVIAIARGIYINNANLGTGSLTSSIGLASAIGTAGDNNCDILIGSSTAPAGNWSLYSLRTDPAVFSGPLTATILGSSPPVTVSTSTHTQDPTESSMIFTATCAVTLLDPAAHSGQWINVKNSGGAFAVTSATANVVPQAGGSAGTAILPAISGKWAELQSDGTNWIIMKSN